MVSLKEMARLDKERAPPAWLHTLLATTFFDACPEHQESEGCANRRTASCNFFCTHCAGHALCSSCLDNHEGHELIQIRKLSGHNAVKVDDVQHLLSVSFVQTYLYNGGYVVFLNRRPMYGLGNRGVFHCEECERGLLDKAYHFCSFGCKAEGIEDRLDFNVSFAVNPNKDETELDDNEGSFSEAGYHMSIV
ncbi:hypothetical protein BDA96_04G083200 [Sorghum bicolor]|uniref:B box-type domain-containing protein n=2 Tax=Sorghum bicolor TaxID=4558 RepID=A0A194YNC2_SORBI|nr:uncharacterized protein LOC8079462 [Sorghum bicolor]KAG0532142.1 hypothetical protein BDA96_04G083200 [Sorghum bicolor]KXG29686.1 hypothetical protein SORBI_3004G076400 [Sorghum bicolor]OQU84554.1 hypothetical protein SORBI_3004G076400 [Sorghum bicolor]|eukprot:XP_002451702.2 uncharacterized protein LOC8079462 [Sorghum bicolor]